jgi:hypothetical protein
MRHFEAIHVGLIVRKAEADAADHAMHAADRRDRLNEGGREGREALNQAGTDRWSHFYWAGETDCWCRS